MKQPEHDLAVVRSFIARSRGRLAVQVSFEALTWSLVVGTLVTVATVFGAIPRGSASPLVSAVTLVAFSAYLFVSMHRNGITLRAVARRIDGRLGLRDRLVTALETSADQSDVAAALHVDTARRTRSLELRHAVPWRWPSRAIAALGAATALLVLAVQVGPLRVMEPRPPTTTKNDVLPDGDQLRRLADAMERSSDSEHRVLSRVVADALRELAAQSDAAVREGADHYERATLEEVLDAWAQGVGLDMTGRDLVERLSATAAPGTDSETAASTGTAAAMEHDLDAGAMDGRTQESEFPEEDAHEMLGISAPTADEEGGADGSDRLDQAQQVDRGGYVSEAALDALRAERSKAMADGEVGATDIIGAADDAAAGDSRLAGLGTEGLEGDQADTIGDLAAQDGTDVTLIGRERDDGRRIDVELPPLQEWRGYDSEAFVVGSWSTGPEAPSSNDRVHHTYRNVAAHFFLPSQEIARRVEPAGR